MKKKFDINSFSKASVAYFKDITNVSKFPLFLLVFLLPIIIFPLFSDPFEFTKLTTTLILAFLSLSALILRFQGKFNDTKLGPVIIALLLITIISAFLGKSTASSLLGMFPNFSQGILTFVTFFFLYFLVSNLLLTVREKKALIATMLAGLSVTLIIIILQTLGVPLLSPFFGNTGVNLIGTSEATRVILLMVVPFAVYFAITDHTIKRTISFVFLALSLFLLIVPQAFLSFQGTVYQLGLIDTFRTIWEGTKSNFLTGIGPANLPYFFDSVKPLYFPESQLTDSYSQYFNNWINLGTAGGIVYTIFLVLIGYHCFKNFKAFDTFRRILTFSIGIFILYQFFAPFNFLINAYFWILLALLFSPYIETLQTVKPRINIYKGLIVGTVLILSLFLIGKMAIADTFFTQGMILQSQQDKKQAAVQTLEMAVNSNPLIDTYHREYAKSIITTLEQPDSSNEAKLKEQIEVVNRAIESGENAVDLNKINKLNYIALTQIYFTGAFFDQSNLPKAIDTAKKATQVAPNDPSIWGNLALVFKQSNQLPQAEDVYKKIVERFPLDIRSYQTLAGFYNEQKNYKSEAETLQKALTLINDQNQKAQIEARIKEVERLATDSAQVQPETSNLPNIEGSIEVKP